MADTHVQEEGIYAVIKDLKFAEIFRIQESPSDIYSARLQQMDIREEDWSRFIDILNELTRTESGVPQPAKDETVDAYITRVAEHRSRTDASPQ